MAELEFVGTLQRGQKVLTHNNSVHTGHNIEVTIGSSPTQGVNISLLVGVTRLDADPDMGDLFDWNAQYHVLIEKVVV